MCLKYANAACSKFYCHTVIMIKEHLKLHTFTCKLKVVHNTFRKRNNRLETSVDNLLNDKYR